MFASWASTYYPILQVYVIIWYVQGIMLSAVDTEMEKQGPNSILKKFAFHWHLPVL